MNLILVQHVECLVVLSLRRGGVVAQDGLVISVAKAIVNMQSNKVTLDTLRVPTGHLSGVSNHPAVLFSCCILDVGII